MKYLLLIIVIIWVWRTWFQRVKKVTQTVTIHSDQAKHYAMVRCVHCGLFLPEDEAIAATGKWFCCEEHRKKFDITA